MAATTDELIARLEEMVECAICLEEFENPRSLPCQHSFCTKCLEDLLGTRRKIRCPCCNKETRVRKGVQELPVDFRANSWLQIMSEYHKAKAAREAECRAVSENTAELVVLSTTSVDPSVHSADSTSSGNPLYQTLLELVSGGTYEPPPRTPDIESRSHKSAPRRNAKPSSHPWPLPHPDLSFFEGSNTRVHSTPTQAPTGTQDNEPVESYSELLAMLEDLATEQQEQRGLKLENVPPQQSQTQQSILGTPPPVPPHNRLPSVASRRLPALPPGSSQGDSQVLSLQSRSKLPRTPEGQSQRSSQGQSQDARSHQVEPQGPMATIPRPSSAPSSTQPNLFSGHSPPPHLPSFRPSDLDSEIPPPVPSTPRPTSLDHPKPPLPPKSFRSSKRGNENLQLMRKAPFSNPHPAKKDVPRSQEIFPWPTRLRDQSHCVQEDPLVAPVFPPSIDETSPPPKMFRSSRQPKPDFEWI